MYPAIDVQPDALYIDEGQIITSAGTAAGLDACLHLIRREHGATAANAIARRMVVAPHRAGNQNQFIEPVPAAVEDPGDLQDLQVWMLANLHRDISVDQLAVRANRSRRSLDRHFRAAAGTSPVQWLLHQRVQAAQRLLETTDLDIDTIARRVGFTTAIALRPHFKRALGVSPRTYRQSFRQGNRSLVSSE
jgi:AraC family transcriptional activator FtrA